jgi:hypothetical protein
MKRYVDLSPDEQGRLCTVAAEYLGLDEGSVEKDFWVCWTLKEIFDLTDIGQHLTFKGGTSLSKGWGLIQRFSEDLDVVVDRAALGFGGDKAPEFPGISWKERARRIEALKEASRAFVTSRLQPALLARIEQLPGGGGEIRLLLDADDPDGQTLLLDYPKSTRTSEYLRPVVKIEVGGRSDTDPNETPAIRPYLEKAAPDLKECAPFRVRTVAPERTFWEKAMLLHEEAHRGSSQGPKARLSRHYYDLHCLIEAKIAAKAADDSDLFEAVANHRVVYFKRSKEAQQTLKPGTLRLRPADGTEAAWRSDYERMTDVMFFDDPPSFDKIMRSIVEFEASYNRAANARQKP